MKKTLLLAALALAGCQSIPADAPRATASLQPTRGNQTSGTVDFVQVGDKVRVHAIVTGLKPNQEHGFHVHEAGDCSSGDGMSTKGHFNPFGKPHAHQGTSDRHAGDLPARPNHGHAPYAELAHAMQRLADAVVLRHDERFARHDVAHGECVRIDVFRRDLYHDVAIGEYSNRRAAGARLVRDDQISDLVFPHDDRCGSHVDADVDGDHSTGTN